MLTFLKNFENFSLKIIDRLENAQISLSTWLISLLCVVFIRDFLEIFSSHINIFSISSASFIFFHSVSFYLMLFLLFSLFLHIITKEKIEKITKASVFAAVLLFLSPLLDFLAGGSKGVMNSYYLFDPNYDVGSIGTFLQAIKSGVYSPLLGLYDAKTFSLTVNFGTRFEVSILMLLIIYYVFLKTKSGLRMILAFLFLQPILFFISTSPYWISKISGVTMFHNISFLNPNFSWNYMMFSFYLIFILILSLLWLRAYDKEKAYALIKNIRFFRTLQIIAVFFFGLYIAGIATAPLKFFDYLIIVMACISLVLYWVSVVLFNDLTDIKGDSINDPERPLPSGKLGIKETKTLAFIFLITSYLSALAVGYVFFIAILLRSCLAYLYSNKPFHLKRIPFISTFVLALAALLTVLGGYLMLPQKSIYDFPINLATLILFVFTLGFNAKDIKDYEGDKAEGIITIPVLLGLERGKFVIGLLSFTCFLLVPFTFPKHLAILIPFSIAMGLLSLFFETRKNYSEIPLFLVYFSYAIIVSLLIF